VTTTRPVVASLLAAALANAALFLPLPHLVQASAALLLAGAVPGFLLVALLTHDTPLPRLERAVHSAGAAVVLIVAVALLLSYLPGDLTRGHLLAAFDALTVALAVAAWVRARRHAGYPARSVAPQTETATQSVASDIPTRSVGTSKYLISALAYIALAALLLAAAFLRFANLGYSDFQGDEARAALRAAAVLQGYDDVLFIHKKGPAEILLPAVVYGLTGRLTEASARLPFALANLAAVAAIWLLGRRLFGEWAGWFAALFLATDGYFIGFARIVQYQSVVVLTTLLAVLALVTLVQRPRAFAPWLTLAALYLAAALLAHYEGALGVIPVAYLWAVLLKESRAARPAILRATLLAAAAGGALVALFYLPYVLAPGFLATFTYLAGERVGGSPPYNNLAETFLRSTLYSTTYAIVLLIALTVAAMLRAYRRGLPRAWAWLFSALAIALVAATILRPAWFVAGERAWTMLPFLVLFGVIVFLPRLTVAERMVWLWFGAVMILALFFTAKPRTHVYTFFLPWFLLGGYTLALGSEWLAARLRPNTQYPITNTQSPISNLQSLLLPAFAALLLAVFGYYAYRLFVSTDEVLLEWDERRPAGYFTFYDQPDDAALFGFPLRTAWKGVGLLYQTGRLDGSYTTNGVNEWVGDWYTRGAPRCPADPDYYIVAEHLKRDQHEERAALLAALPAEHHPAAQVLLRGAPRLEVWARGALTETAAAPEVVNIEEAAPVFDAEYSSPDFPLQYPTIIPPSAHAVGVEAAPGIVLAGYTLDPERTAPGGTLDLTLAWRATGPNDVRYMVAAELRDAAGAAVASTQGEPACGALPTDDWPTGEIVVDAHRLAVSSDAPPGVYHVTVQLLPAEGGAAGGAPVTLGPVEVALP
jgi:4-amino-4-deoxy-L-arabinose transferase-like glycosyltransferase